MKHRDRERGAKREKEIHKDAEIGMSVGNLQLERKVRKQTNKQSKTKNKNKK